MTSKFTEKAEGAINRALRFASEMGHTYIGSEHILYGLTAETDSVGITTDVKSSAMQSKRLSSLFLIFTPHLF